jgi:DNA polymerase-3 subunit gamma/tau
LSYLVIARKYRPQTFDEVIGQEHISRTLKNAIKLGKISHAYLFTGPRGIGKTTTARILAKAVNCTDRKTEEPCNRCDSCLEITNSKSVDIIEIDAASNRGIDEIRELRENVKFAPASTKYKVYIIDEVHMLTKEAFNAILKTLEEPPAHVIFIMATTEPEKVLETITSRCQTFNFRLIPEQRIKETLQEIAQKEKAEFEEEGLWHIARAARGSMRDGQSLMDQALSYSGGKIIAQEVSQLLGLIPREFLFSYTDYIKNQDIKSAMNLTQKLMREGYNISRLFSDLIAHFRNLMFAKVFDRATDFLGFSADYSENLAGAAKHFPKEQLVWITEFLSMNSSRMKFADDPHIVMDTILFKLCQRYVSFEDVLNTVNPSEKHEEPIRKTGTGSPEKKPAEGGRWERILGSIEKDSQPLYHLLKEAEVSLKEKKIIIKSATPIDLNERYIKILNDKIKEIMGDGYYPEIRKEIKAPETKTETPKKLAVSPAKIEQEEPIVGNIVEMFGGRIEKG